MPDLERGRLERYLTSLRGGPVEIRELHRIGEAAGGEDVKEYGYGEPVKVTFDGPQGEEQVVIETIHRDSFGHQHMADRAQSLLWAHRAFNHLPGHVPSLDVGGFYDDGRMVSLGAVEELFIVLPFVEGEGYQHDLERLRDGAPLRDLDRQRADALADYLIEIHAEKRREESLYHRRIRELVGHGECIMGLVDSYPLPHGFITAELLEEIEHQVVKWRWRLKKRSHRLCQVHGDFHPWNILFEAGTRYHVLDRARGEWGEPADDVTSITLNYLFFSLQHGGRLEGGLRELFEGFWSRYLEGTGDDEILEVAAPFMVFRLLVMASPVWYPHLSEEVRRALFRLAERVLAADRFDPAEADRYLEGRP